MIRILALLLFALPAQVAGPFYGPVVAGVAPNTWTLVRHTLDLLPCNGTTSCAAPVSAIGAGHVLVLVEGGQTGFASTFINAAPGGSGGAWVHPGGSSSGACNITQNAVSATDCAFVLASVSCASSCSITYTLNHLLQNDSVDIFEYAPSTGSASYDAAATLSGSASTTPPVVALTISGSSDLVIQSIVAQDNPCTAIASPYTSATDFNSSGIPTGFAAAINLSSVTASPTWTCGSTRYITMGVAFK